MFKETYIITLPQKTKYLEESQGNMLSYWKPTKYKNTKIIINLQSFFIKST